MEHEINELERQYEEARMAWQKEDAARWDLDAQIQHQTTLACQDIECALGRLKMLDEQIKNEDGEQPPHRYFAMRAQLEYIMRDMKTIDTDLRKMK